jgi:hypothetical protein
MVLMISFGIFFMVNNYLYKNLIINSEKGFNKTLYWIIVTFILVTFNSLFSGIVLSLFGGILF